MEVRVILPMRVFSGKCSFFRKVFVVANLQLAVFKYRILDFIN
jgi:hypothetical protein